MCNKPGSYHAPRPPPRERHRKRGYSPAPRGDPAPRKPRNRDARARYPCGDTSSDGSAYSESTASERERERERYARGEPYSRGAPSRRGVREPRHRGDEYGRDRYRGDGAGRGVEPFGRESDTYWERKRPYGYRRYPLARAEYGSERPGKRPEYPRYESSSDDSSYHSRYEYDRYRDSRRDDPHRDDRHRDDRHGDDRHRDDRHRDDRHRRERRSVERDRRHRYLDRRDDRNTGRPSGHRSGSDEGAPRRSGREGKGREGDAMPKRYHAPERQVESKQRRMDDALNRNGNTNDNAKLTNDQATRGSAPKRPPGKEETYWQRRRELRENNPCSPVWDVSPSPPHRIEDRLEVGADERQKKDRKRQRKEERRAKREAKRARKAEKEAETNKKPEPLAPPQHPEKPAIGPQMAADIDDEEEEVVGPALPPSKEKGKLDYGKALRPGEGSKMAAFVQDGARIPRRGEIGLTSDEISKFEDHGYVMSGSRNRRMEAVRIRKENQVYSAEELAALSQFSREERKAREERMLSHFRTLVEAKRKDAEVSKPVEDENGNPVQRLPNVE